MSRDPLDELFGPRDEDAADTSAAQTQAYNPFPAPEGEPAQATVEELFPNATVIPDATVLPNDSTSPNDASLGGSAPLPETAAFAGMARANASSREELSREEPPTRPVPANRGRSGRALPWIVISAVALLLLIGALIFVNMMTGDDTETTPTPEPTATEEPPAPSETPSETPSEEPSIEPTPSATEAPDVEVGNTGTMEISYAGISVDFSYKLTDIQWFYQAGPPERVMIETGLMNSFPDSCAAMRSPVGQSPWGIEALDTGGWGVVRPEGTCAANPELYDEVWGLMQALADSAKPLGSD